MRFGEKLKQLIQARGYPTVIAFHRRIVEIFEDEAISLNSLHKILNKPVSKIWEQHLYQFTTILEIKRIELLSGTNLETKTHHDKASFAYNEASTLHLLDHRGPMAIERLSLRHGGATVVEQDKPSAELSFKAVWILKGRIDLYLKKEPEDECISLKANEGFSFNAQIPHYFKNAGDQHAWAIITHYPTKNCFLVAK